MTSISRDEWLKALSDAGAGIQDDPSAITIAEFAQMFGLNWQAASRRLRLLVSKGQAIETRKVGTGRDGRRCDLIAFRLIDVNPKVKKRKPS
jgi:hypothetical protein